jgi:lysophospholipase L1-like esterase
MVYIVVFGDSITWGAWDPEGGWVARLLRWLEERDQREHIIYNCGVSGDGTPELLQRFEVEARARFLEPTADGSPKMLIIAIGDNDSGWFRDEGRHVTPPEQFRANVQRLIEMARRQTSKVVFIGTTPVDDAKTDPLPWAANRVHKNEYTVKYDKIAKDVCDKNGIPFVEIYNTWLKADYRNLLEDGVHPNAAGHQRLFEAVRDALLKNKLL